MPRLTYDLDVSFCVGSALTRRTSSVNPSHGGLVVWVVWVRTDFLYQLLLWGLACPRLPILRRLLQLVLPRLYVALICSANDLCQASIRQRTGNCELLVYPAECTAFAALGVAASVTRPTSERSSGVPSVRGSYCPFT